MNGDVLIRVEICSEAVVYTLNMKSTSMKCQQFYKPTLYSRFSVLLSLRFQMLKDDHHND